MQYAIDKIKGGKCGMPLENDCILDKMYNGYNKDRHFAIQYVYLRIS